MISYCLYYASSNTPVGSNAPPGAHLLLMLRNIGAKFVSLEHVSTNNFELRDAQGRDIGLSLRSTPRGMAFGQLEIIHLVVHNAADAAPPWGLRFSTYDAGLSSPVFVAINGIEPSKAPAK